MKVDPEKDRQWASWMIQAQAGDGQAYNHLLTEFSEFLEGYIRARLYQTDNRQDLIQDILLAVHKSRHTFLPGRSFFAWGMSIARYKYIDHLRSLMRRVQRETYDIQAIDMAAAPVEEEPDTAMSDALRAAVAKLPGKQKTIIELMKFEGKSVREVASRLGMSEVSVRVTAHRGYRQLHRVLKEFAYEY